MSTHEIILQSLVRALRSASTPERAAGAARYFKTGPGEYGEGDIFLGVSVPDLRRVARQYQSLPLSDVEQLLRAPEHECRAAALLILVAKFKRADSAAQQFILDLYLRNTEHINNWDLVDMSCREIVGAGLSTSGTNKLLTCLAKSASVWERRIAIISTMALIRRGFCDEAIRIAKLLLRDKHPLIHKAAGWALREVGDVNRPALMKFLEEHYAELPRTTVRYAIEHFSPVERQRMLKGEFNQSAATADNTSAGSGRTRKSA